MDTKAHWDAVYKSKAPQDTSWYQASPEPSLSVVRALGLDPDDPIIDVGAGASALIDALVDEGFRRVSALDVSAEAIERASVRLGPQRSSRVEWVTGDIRDWRPRPRWYALWHDRAMLHFLTDEADRRRYAESAGAGVRPGGHMVIAAFAADGGPTKCSGLEVRRHDAASIVELFGGAFDLLEHWPLVHATPWGAEQRFEWFLLRRRPD